MNKLDRIIADRDWILDQENWIEDDLDKLLSLTDEEIAELRRKKVYEIAEARDLEAKIEEALNTLTPRERKVLELRFGFLGGRSYTLEEVGREFKVTRERIRQIEAKALRKLRSPIRSRGIRSYVGGRR